MIKMNEAEMATVDGEGNVTMFASFGTKDAVWYLVSRETINWPNGNPRRALYETLWGNRLVAWFNEAGGLVYARYV